MIKNDDFDLEAKPELRKLGKNPTPRDGHAAVVAFNSLIVFGGDRHRMPFNDLLILPLHHLIWQLNNSIAASLLRNNCKIYGQ